MRTIQELNNKVSYRALKVLFSALLLLVLFIANSELYGSDFKKLDLEKSTVVCNKNTSLEVDRHVITLADVGAYFDSEEFENYNYTSFIKNNEFDALAIVNKCQEDNKYGFRILGFGTSTTTDFVVRPVFSYSDFLKNFFSLNFAILLVFEIIRRTFYYIFLGTVKPVSE